MDLDPLRSKTFGCICINNYCLGPDVDPNLLYVIGCYSAKEIEHIFSSISTIGNMVAYNMHKIRRAVASRKQA